MKHKLSLDNTATYQILVQGYLEEHWSDWFNSIDIEPKVDTQGTCITRLTCIVIDQAALHGILRKLYDLGMPLLSVSCLTLEDV